MMTNRLLKKALRARTRPYLRLTRMRRFLTMALPKEQYSPP
jgi:hypothetical protein